MIHRSIRVLRLRADDGTEFSARHANRGEPYREGMEFVLTQTDYSVLSLVFVDDAEAVQLRDLLNEVYPP